MPPSAHAMANKKKVLVTDGLAPAALDLLKKQEGLQVVAGKFTPEQVLKEVADAQAIVVRSATKVTRQVIEAGPQLKLIARAGVGLDNVDQAAAKERGIAVRNTPACTSVSVAELALGLMLTVARKIGRANISMKAREWDKKAFEGCELLGKTLGLIGIGRIGQEVAKRARAFGMAVLAHDPFVQKSPMAEVKLVGLDELLTQSHFVSLHIPFDKTKGPTLGEAQFKKMKKGCFLVNCARGGTVDEKALLAALNDGTVAAAGIDVWQKEPTENVELVGHANVVALPHLGASTVEGQDRAGIEVAEIVIEILGK